MWPCSQSMIMPFLIISLAGGLKGGIVTDVKAGLGYYLSCAERGKAQECHYGLCICSESIKESQLRVECCDCHG